MEQLIEQWKDIPGYEGLYQVSNTGKVRSLDYRGTGKVKVLKHRTLFGYHIVNLHSYGIQKSHRVHRLVAQAFLPNPDNLPIINHKDENPANNNVDNLEWCTQKYNLAYGTLRERARETNIKNGIWYEDSKKHRLEYKRKYYKEYNRKHRDKINKYQRLYRQRKMKENEKETV